MPTDRYTKAVLTVIAAALVGILAQHAFQPAGAQPASPAVATACGGLDKPCYVTPAFYDSVLKSWIACARSSSNCFVVGSRPVQ